MRNLISFGPFRPPYILHYFLILALEQHVAAVTADKIFVCLILINLAFGFRYLVMALGPAGDVFSLLVVAILFNWPLGMGFENFSFCAGLACWCLGVWARLQTSRARGHRVAFVLLLVVMMLTHPVPVVLVVAFAGLDLLLRSVAGIVWKERNRMPTRLDVITLAAGSCTLAYVLFFTNAHRVASAARAPFAPLTRMLHFSRLYGIAFFGGPSKGALLYQLALYLIFLAGVSVGVVSARRQLKLREWTPPLTWLAAAGMLICGLPFLPVDLNGSHWFADRLMIFLWIAVLAACSASTPSRLMRASMMVFAVLMTGGILTLGNTHLRPVANRIAAMRQDPTLDREKVGVLLPAAAEAQYSFNDDLRFYPFLWAGRIFFASITISCSTRPGWICRSCPWERNHPSLRTASVLRVLKTGVYCGRN